MDTCGLQNHEFETVLPTAQNRTMDPTHDAFDVDGKEGDNTGSPEEISFPYKLRDKTIPSQTQN